MLTLRIFCRQISSILSPSVNLAMNHLFSDLQSVKPILASLQNTEGVESQVFWGGIPEYNMGIVQRVLMKMETK